MFLLFLLKVFSGKTTYTALQEESDDKPYATNNYNNNTRYDTNTSLYSGGLSVGQTGPPAPDFDRPKKI